MRDDSLGLGSAGKSGRLYYVRLSTKLGKFYKIGFTTLSSVNDRLAFQGTGDEKFIEEVLYFKAHDNAFEIEDWLHTFFSDKAAFPKYSAHSDMPLPRNGQTELYFDDVLELDSKFTQAQADESRGLVELAFAKRTYSSDIWAKRMLFVSKSVSGVLMGSVKVIVWSIKVIQKTIGIKPYEPTLLPSVLEKREKAKTFLNTLKKERQAESFRKHKELRIMFLIHFFSNRDVESFKDLVNIDELARDIATSLTSDLVMFSDYLCIPNNCGMLALMDGMDHSNCHELLIRPAADSYVPMIEEFLAGRKITDMSIKMPSDPLYAVDSPRSNSQITYNDYFGAQEFIGLLECKYVSRGPFVHDVSNQSISFSVKLLDGLTSRFYDLSVVVNLSKKKLRFSFPNAMDLIRQYQDQHESTNFSVQ